MRSMPYFSTSDGRVPVACQWRFAVTGTLWLPDARMVRKLTLGICVWKLGSVSLGSVSNGHRQSQQWPRQSQHKAQNQTTPTWPITLSMHQWRFPVKVCSEGLQWGFHLSKKVCTKRFPVKVCSDWHPLASGCAHGKEIDPWHLRLEAWVCKPFYGLGSKQSILRSALTAFSRSILWLGRLIIAYWQARWLHFYMVFYSLGSQYSIRRNDFIAFLRGNLWLVV